jgi:hypothetical protein
MVKKNQKKGKEKSLKKQNKHLERIKKGKNSSIKGGMKKHGVVNKKIKEEKEIKEKKKK